MALDKALLDDVVELRHTLHGHPEIGEHLPRTQAAVLEALAGLDQEGLTVLAGEDTGDGMSSVTVVLRGAAPVPEGMRRPVVLLRGDMDGLPVTELTGLDFAPETPGTMHACGHDMHTAGLYGALRVLSERRSELVADVIGMFQPAEETEGGAAPMIAAGLLDAAGRRADSAYAVHVYSSRFQHGQFASRAGAIQASCDDFVVTVNGRGGHGSAPHLSQDPVPVLCEMVLALQTMVTRQFDSFDPVVVTVGHIVAGTASNIIPDTAHAEITMRAFSAEARSRLLASAERLLRGIADAHGLSVSIEHPVIFPVTENHADHVQYGREIAEELFGPEAFQEMERPEAGSEDFSWVLQEVPGAYFNLGAVPEGVSLEDAPTNHSPHSVFDDAVLARSVEFLAELALRKTPLPADDRA